MKAPVNNRYMQGVDPMDCGFSSQKEMLSAMSDPRYKSDPEFRQLVEWQLFNEVRADNAPPAQEISTGREMQRAMANVPEARHLEDQAIYRESVAAMFGDPRYAVSATYRKEVREWIAANESLVDAGLGSSVIDRSASPKSFKVQMGEGDASAVRESIRATKEAEARQEAEEAKRAIDADLENSLTIK